MTPEEWPIAAPTQEAAAPTHAADRGRLRTVRSDFFLPPDERLSEQERALMAAMLHCLVEELASELRALLPACVSPANDGDNAQLVGSLMRAGLVDDPDLIGLLLQRAEEERIGSAARARSGRREARALQALVSHSSAEISAAAMGLILARGRRRNRFGQCVLTVDDLPRRSAEALANAVAAALATASQAHSDDHAPYAAAAAQLTGRHNRGRSVEALTRAVVEQLDQAGELTDDLLLACAQEGEIAFIAAVAAVRGDLSLAVANNELLSADERRVGRLMRVGGLSRASSAGILASIGDLLSIDDPGAAINAFDSLNEAQLVSARDWLSASSAYREAIEILGGRHG